MTFLKETLNNSPGGIRDVALPRRTYFREGNDGEEIPYYPSPVDWASEVLYFLLPDRFSDGLDKNRNVYDHTQAPWNSRPADFLWIDWAESGGGRWQGGTIKGITSRLDYLAHLGITAIWIGPVFKQRRHSNEYHGYAIQNFLEVDPHFGTRKDLIDLVISAHDLGIRVILDVIFNHSGHNWDYEGNRTDPPYLTWPDYYNRGDWLDSSGGHTPYINNMESGVWPEELQRPECYTRAGKGSLSGNDVDDPHCEMRRTDFDGSFRDFNFDDSATLSDIARCYKYWIALTDIDGMRLDTLKHVSKETARAFCGSIKEFAVNLGKADFLLIGEIAGSDNNAGKYLDALELNLNAALDIGDSRIVLTNVAKGLEAPSDYFDMMQPWDTKLGSHRNSAQRHVKIIDDHDHVCGRKVRFSTDTSNDHQVCAAVALQLFTLGIPCIYYGTEQAFAGPEKSERDQYLSDFGGGTDKYLRETMFGAPHPHRSGAEGLPAENDPIDPGKPGFGAFGTTNCNFFNEDHPVYKRIRHLLSVRRKYPALRYGRQYLRPIRNFGNPFTPCAPGELIAWSRILDDEEILCIVNGHGTQYRGGDIIVDLELNSAESSIFRVIANTMQTAGTGSEVAHQIGSTVQVKANGSAFVELRDIGPSEAVILINR